jgi:hypothetical protein
VGSVGDILWVLRAVSGGLWGLCGLYLVGSGGLWAKSDLLCGLHLRALWATSGLLCGLHLVCSVGSEG